MHKPHKHTMQQTVGAAAEKAPSTPAVCIPHLQAVGREGNGSRLEFGVLKLLHTLAAACTPKPKRPVEAASHHELAIGRESGTSDVVCVARKVGAKALAGGHVQQLHLQGVGGRITIRTTANRARELCNALLMSFILLALSSHPQHATGLAADGGEQNTPVIGEHGQAYTLVLLRRWCWELSKAAA